jgi:hypothetical protein
MGVKVKDKKKETTRSRIPSFEEFLAILEKNRSHCTREDAVKSLKEEIESYEKKYKMPTQEFVERYDSGEFETDSTHDDFELDCWYGAYHSYQELIQESEEGKG